MTWEPTAPAYAGLHLLIVEDDADLRDVLCEAFEIEGAHVHAAAGPAEALAWLHTGAQVDVVLCDLVMAPPGPEVLYRIVRAHRDRPAFVLLTGLTHGPLYEAARRAMPDCDAWLTKPADLHDLYVTLRTLARRRALAPSHRPPN